jgi:protein TonB
MHPAAAICRTAGNWRLDRLPKSSTVFLALALSLGVHATFLLAFNQHGTRIISVITHPKPTIIDWLPVVEPEPPPTVTEVKELEETPAVNVPRQLDVPSPVTLLTDFVQPLQPPAPAQELNPDKIARIPTNISNSDPRAHQPKVFERGQLDKAPRAVAQPAPRFPTELQHEVSSAELVVEFIIDTSGAVQGATIVSSTHHGFDRAALEGVRQWKFRPGIKDGRKVNTRILQPIRFALEDSPGT